jgi:NADH-ubiquinone oxidoreductase chain 1
MMEQVGFVGILQPFRDAIKLFTKEQYFPLVSNYLIYYFSPIFGVFLSLLVWLLVPYLSGFISFELGVFFGLYYSWGLYCYNCWVVF